MTDTTDCEWPPRSQAPLSESLRQVRWLTATLLLLVLAATTRSLSVAEASETGDSEWSAPVDGLQTRLTLLTPGPRLGAPIYARLELRNTAGESRYIWDQLGHYARSLMLPDNGVSNGRDPAHRPWESNSPVVIAPGEMIRLFWRRDLAPILKLQRPGQITISTAVVEGGTATVQQRNGDQTEQRSLRVSTIPASRPVSVRVNDGPLPEFDGVVRRLKERLPRTWTIAYENQATLTLLPRGLMDSARQAERDKDQNRLQEVQRQLQSCYSCVGAFGDEDELDPEAVRKSMVKDGDRFEVLGRSERGPVLLLLKKRLLDDWPGGVEELRQLFVNIGPDAPRPLQTSRVQNIRCWHDENASAFVLVHAPQRNTKNGGVLPVTWKGDQPRRVTIGDGQFELSAGRLFEVDESGNVTQEPLHWLPVVTRDSQSRVLDAIESLRRRVLFRRLKEDVQNASHRRIDPDARELSAFEQVMAQFELGFPLDPEAEPDMEIREFFLSDQVQPRMINSLNQVIGAWGSHRQLYAHAIRIIRELGRPADLKELSGHFGRHSDKSPLSVLALDQSELKLRLRPESLARQFLEAAREVARRSDQPVKLPGRLGTLDFLQRLRSEPGFRPNGWEKRLARCLPEGMRESQLITLYATESIPLDLTLPDDPGRANSSDDLLQRICYVTRGHLAPRPQEQIAMLRFVARTRSCWFLPHIRAAQESKNSGVQTAARRALQACTPPAWAEDAGTDDQVHVEFTRKRIDGVLEEIEQKSKLEELPDEPVTVEEAQQLRRLTGLDYGQDHQAWLTWWKDEKYSRKIAADNMRTILISGTVTDEQGKPVQGARTMLSLRDNFVYGGKLVAQVHTDRHGRYVLRAGYSTSSSKPTDQFAIGVRPGWLFVEKPGYQIKVMSRPQRLYFSKRDISQDSIVRLPAHSLQQTEKRLQVDIRLSPAVEVKVRVEDAQGQPLKPVKVSAHWTASATPQFSPSESCFCCNEHHAWPDFFRHDSDPAGHMRCDLTSRKETHFSEYRQFRAGIARSFAVYLNPREKDKPHNPDGTSPALTFDRPGRYIIRLRYNQSAEPAERISIAGSRLAR